MIKALIYTLIVCITAFLVAYAIAYALLPEKTYSLGSSYMTSADSFYSIHQDKICVLYSAPISQYLPQKPLHRLDVFDTHLAIGIHHHLYWKRGILINNTFVYIEPGITGYNITEYRFFLAPQAIDAMIKSRARYISYDIYMLPENEFNSIVSASTSSGVSLRCSLAGVVVSQWVNSFSIRCVAPENIQTQMLSNMVLVGYICLPRDAAAYKLTFTNGSIRYVKLASVLSNPSVYTITYHVPIPLKRLDISIYVEASLKVPTQMLLRASAALAACLAALVIHYSKEPYQYRLLGRVARRIHRLFSKR